MSKIKLNGKVIKEIYKNGDFKILAFSPNSNEISKVKINKYGSISLKGELGMLNVGNNYELEIEEIETTVYGTSYRVISIPSLSQIDLSKLSLEESKAILTSFTTENQANNILKAYPDFIYKIINEGKESIDVKNIYGVGDAYLTAYTRELTNRYKYIHILNHYADYKFNVSDCKVLYEIYGNDERIQEAVNNNPYYVLIEILHRGFETADKLLQEVRPELIESEQRTEAIVADVLHRNENDGSTKMNACDMYSYAKEYDERLCGKIKSVCENSENIYYNSETKDVALMNTYLGELKVADFIKTKLENSTQLDIDWSSYKVNEDGSELTDTQLSALEKFCNYNVSILSGFSGSGKTFSVQGLIKLMEDNHLSYTLVSPTGKASRVLSESTHRPACTIHKKCYEGEITSDVIIVDEFGMVSLDVMIMLLNAVTNENARFVFVGDNAQIPSISLGKVFDDFINSEVVPITTLTEIFRYKSNGSLYVATNVRQGHSFFEDKDMVNQKDNVYSVCNNYDFIEVEEDAISDTVIDAYESLIAKGIKQKDIMILSPMNVGDMGTYALNNRIQSDINPPKANEKTHSRKINNTNIVFRQNDIVLNTKNDYNAVSYEAYKTLKEDELHILTEDDVADSIIVNGQTGVIREVLDDGLIVQFDEELIFVSKSKLNNLLLGYSISTFKAQGSSVDYVIDVISNKHQKMLSRGLIYVADTRCRKKCIDVGNVSAYEKGLTVVINNLRNTFLKDMLKEEFNGKDITK